MKECEVPTNIIIIKRFEKIIGTNLPNDYIEWLFKYNGGKPVIERTYKFIEPIDKNELYGGVNYFYALYNGDACNLEKTYNTLLGRMPNEMIPIANDSCGNKICLGIKGQSRNKVYFWDHENEVMNENEEPWWKNVYLIANTFTDFINKLFYAEINEEEWEKHKKIVYTYHSPSANFD